MGGEHWIHLPGLASFSFSPGRGEVTAAPTPAAGADVIADTFYRNVLPLALQASGERAFHGLTATRRDWRRKGVATALKRAEISAAKRAGFKRLLTESEERNEPMQRLNEKLGFVPAPEWSTVVIRGPLA